MNNPKENNLRFVKTVFSSTTSDFNRFSKYTLGEDYYSIQKEDKEIKINNITKLIVTID